MKLFVDDIRNPPDDSWHICRTVGAAVRALAQFGPTIEAISFDHDISHQVAVGSVSRPYPCEETYQPVAEIVGLLYELLRFKGVNCIPRITVHSANPTGARHIEKILAGYGLSCEIAPLGQANRLEMFI